MPFLIRFRPPFSYASGISTFIHFGLSIIRNLNLLAEEKWRHLSPSGGTLVGLRFRDAPFLKNADLSAFLKMCRNMGTI